MPSARSSGTREHDHRSDAVEDKIILEYLRHLLDGLPADAVHGGEKLRPELSQFAKGQQYCLTSFTQTLFGIQRKCMIEPADYAVYDHTERSYQKSQNMTSSDESPQRNTLKPFPRTKWRKP